MNFGSVMRILITGNMGYIGPLVVQDFRERFSKAELIGFDIGYFAHCLTSPEILPEVLLDTQHYGDVRAVSDRVLQGVDCIVHLAAISNDPMGQRFASATHEINFTATCALAARAKKVGVKGFVFASSCSVYGSSDKGSCDEASETRPLTDYAQSKVESEQELHRLADSAFRIRCLRFATACGMSPRLRLDLVLNDFCAGAVTTGAISILSDGTPWRPLIHVKDMARAFAWAVQHSLNHSQHFLMLNVGSDEWNYQVKELAHAVALQCGGTKVTINKTAPVDKRSYRVCFDLFKKLAPDFQPKVSLQQAVMDLCQGVQGIDPQSLKNFHESDFMRLKVLQKLQAQRRLDGALRWL